MNPSSHSGRLDVGIAAGGQLRWTAVELRGVVEEARTRLDLAPLPTVAFGRCAAAASMLLRLSSKSPIKLDLDARGDGPLARVLIEVGLEGDLRGLVGSRRACGADGDRDLRVGPALGQGVLRIGRHGVAGTSYHSHVELVSGEIGADVAHFLAQSEQRRSAVLLGVLLDRDGVSAAGGAILEALPDAGPRTVEKLEDKIGRLGSVSRRIEEAGIEGLLAEVLSDLKPETLDTQELRYRCPYDRHRLASQLAALSREDIQELAEADGTLDAKCSFCGEVYNLRLEELLPS